ncbi:MAG TPA: hypothetical protein VLA01_02595 [Nitrosopumilaceae archaeon]|nr:hypothetical protein [Nitrosopumilaceae archaeon]
MVRVFYTQQTEQLLKKMELKHWRELTQDELNQSHRDLSDNWKTCAIGERIKIEGKELKDLKDLTPEAIKLGYDFSIAMQERDNQRALEILAKIESLETIWRVEQ